MPNFASLDNQPIFGGATTVQMQPNASAQQIAAFFGVQGTQALYGGTRGRAFMIEGCLTGFDPSVLRFAEFIIETFADGLPHILGDNWGTIWLNVVYKNEYQRIGKPRPTNEGWCQPYRLVMMGLS